jgi:DNA-binding MarR family transcriptional regulator
LRRLEKDGAIERRPHPTNQRADSWYITKSGRASMERTRIVAEGVWEQMFESLKPSEVNQLLRLLERGLAGFEQKLSDSRAAKTGRARARATTSRA